MAASAAAFSFLTLPTLALFSQGAQGFLAGSTLRHFDQLDRLAICVHLPNISVDGKHTAYVFNADSNVIPSEVRFVIWQNILYVYFLRPAVWPFVECNYHSSLLFLQFL
jgi:hypothetical protein